jgi:hypothetical protein
MVDDIQPNAAAPVVCTWCSAPLPTPEPDHCPACGAILTGELAEPLPGITAVDATAVLRGTPTTTRPRNRLLSWINGDYPEDAISPADAKALELPDAAVKREMLRLELEGEVASLKAQADALVAEAAAEGRVVELPDHSALSEAGIAAAEAALRTDDEAADAAAAGWSAPVMPAATEAETDIASAAAADPATATDPAGTEGAPPA